MNRFVGERILGIMMLHTITYKWILHESMGTARDSIGDGEQSNRWHLIGVSQTLSSDDFI